MPRLVRLSALAESLEVVKNSATTELLKSLTPPPADDSTQAQADDKGSEWRFADVLGPQFTRDNLPTTGKLFDRLHEVENTVIDDLKNRFGRTRPYNVNPQIKPVVRRPKASSYSYPSGHATSSMLTALMLVDMVPEKRDEILSRAKAYGENRIVGGVHYRSDVGAGWSAAHLMAQILLRDDNFITLLGRARTELRDKLGLQQVAAIGETVIRLVTLSALLEGLQNIKYRDAVAHLKKHGATAVRQVGGHETWRHAGNGTQTAVPVHNQIKGTTFKGICKTLGIHSHGCGC